MTTTPAATIDPDGSSIPFNATIYVAVAAATAASSFISLLVNCLVLFFIVLFKRWSFFNQRLIIYLSLATIAGSVAGILARIDYDNQTGEGYENFCIFSGFLQQITGWMSLNAYICITSSLLIKAYFTINLEKLDIPVVLFIFASPILINWIPFIQGGYGPSGAWCWIRSVAESNYGDILQLILWYVPVYVILCVLIIIYSVVVINFCLQRKKCKSDPQAWSDRKQALRYTISLLAYPIICFLANLFPFVNRIYGLANPNSPLPALWFLSGISYHVQSPGIAIAFLVGIKSKLNKVSIKAAFSEWCHKVEIEEYPMTSDVLEKSVSTYHNMK